MEGVSAGSSIVQASWPHTANVLVHVVFGTLALIIGFVQLMAPQGGVGHISRGRRFVGAVWIVVATAAIGLLVFRSGVVLALVTLVVAYWNYSGSRAVQIRHTGPALQDAVVSMCGLTFAGLVILFVQRVRFPWAPSVVYSTLGTLAVVALYDLARFTFPRRWFDTLWLYEHIVKMIGAHGSMAAAFAGTVLWMWQPYSQMITTPLWTAAQIGFVMYARRRWHIKVELMKQALAVVLIGILGHGAFAQSPVPGLRADQRRLRYFVGQWIVEEKIAGETHMKQQSCGWFAGGVHLVCDAEGTSPLGVMTTHSIMGHNPEDRTFSFYSVSSLGSAVFASGTVSGPSWTGTTEFRFNGEIVKAQITFTEQSPTSWTYTLEGTFGSGQSIVLEEARATKVS